MKLNIEKTEVSLDDDYCVAYQLQQLINQLKIMTPTNDKIGLSLIKELERFREIQKKEGKTMNKEELQELISDLQNQLKTTQDKLEKIGKYERFKPEEGKRYFCVDNYCEVNETLYSRDFSDYYMHGRLYNAYNCFKTKEEAEKEANKILIRRKLEDISRRLNGDEKIDWNDENREKYFIYYMCGSIELDYAFNKQTQGTVYCLSEDFLKVAIEEIGEQELINYIKGE